MKEKEYKTMEEAGWEFSLPWFAGSRLFWLWIILLIIAVVLSAVLIIKTFNIVTGGQIISTNFP